MLIRANSMGMRRSSTGPSHFDPVTGIEISRLGSVEVKWLQLFCGSAQRAGRMGLT